jgi:hypothetical protein
LIASQPTTMAAPDVAGGGVPLPMTWHWLDAAAGAYVFVVRACMC